MMKGPKDFLLFLLIALLTAGMIWSLIVHEHPWFWKAVLILNLVIYIPFLLVKSFIALKAAFMR
jgi:hypothetical protein